MDIFFTTVSESDINKEKQAARELRRTRWWKEKIGKGVCEYCNGQFTAESLTMDHIVPIARGGKTVKNNIACACKECNNRKKYLLPMEWDEYINKKK